ncbi:MAG: hypothetical protein ABI647_15885 [Gemmatimonadota bacterium]
MATKRPRKSGGYGRRAPEWGTRDHEITHDQAIRMRNEYESSYGNTAGALSPGAYDRKIFDRILKQKGCRGIRLYPGVNRGSFVIIVVGVDVKGDDILAGIIGETPFRRPPYGSSPNGILQG